MGDDSKKKVETDRKRIVVTGFGPFGEHKVNASWEAVQELVKLGLDLDVELITEQLDVVYDVVKQRVPQMWSQYKPLLMVHVGVSGIADKVTFEQQAFNTNYVRRDVNNCIPDRCICVDGGMNCIQSGIDMAKVCQDINNAPGSTEAEISLDPGRYLCEYTFYTSLSIDKSRSAFIHVPVLDKPYTAKELGEAIKVAVHSMVQQLP